MKSKLDLLQLGFSNAGAWQLYPRKKSGVQAHLSAYHKERVIYAFLVADECKYIGICENSDTTLADRMGRYENKVGGSTNKRICELIQQSLATGRSVEIMALKPEASFEFAELKVDLVKGLENPMIQWADPQWNIKGKSLTGSIRYVSLDSLMPKEK